MRPDNADYRRGARAGRCLTARHGTRAASVVCCDLDGVVWRGDTPIPGSAEGIAQLRAGGLPRRVHDQQLEHRDRRLRRARSARFGVPAEPDDVCTSAQAAAALVASKVGPRRDACSRARARVWSRRSTGHGLRVVGRGAVRRGGRGLSPRLRLRAADASPPTPLAARALFVATNLDPTYPVDGGLVPGAGALAAAVATAAGRRRRSRASPSARWPTWSGRASATREW